MITGECECREGYIPWDVEEEAIGVCYQEFFQGPCPDGHQLLNIDDVSVCQETDCPNKQIRWKNGQCVDPIECNDEDYEVWLPGANSKNICH